MVQDRALKKQKENKTELIIKDWLVSYSRRVNEQSSTEQKMTVLPFRNIKPVYHQYTEDFKNQEDLRTQDKPLSSSQFGKLFNIYSNQLKIRIQRNIGAFFSLAQFAMPTTVESEKHTPKNNVNFNRF